jgi:hypothetical protein
MDRCNLQRGLNKLLVIGGSLHKYYTNWGKGPNYNGFLVEPHRWSVIFDSLLAKPYCWSAICDSLLTRPHNVDCPLVVLLLLLPFVALSWVRRSSSFVGRVKFSPRALTSLARRFALGDTRSHTHTLLIDFWLIYWTSLSYKISCRNLICYLNTLFTQAIHSLSYYTEFRI